MSKAITVPQSKAKRRQSIRGHAGIERGSTNAARLYWQDADAIAKAAGPDGRAALPKPSRYGFESQPTPPTRRATQS